MLAREKYSEKEIAKYWECPVSFIYACKKIKAEYIGKMRKEMQELMELQREIANSPYDGEMVSEKDAVLALCELILDNYNKREKEFYE